VKKAAIGNKKPLGGILGGISKGIGSAGKGIKKALVGDQDEGEENCEECDRIESIKMKNKKQNDEDEIHGYRKNIQEKNNISKFLKHLSEKNYSSAHKYLKAVLNSKINKTVSERIEKNFK
jgi:Sec-independent protein translocase protein TatA